MPTVPVDGRVLWPSTAASIPANWSRDADFDDRYLQGGSSAGSNGGASTHTHTISGTHSHTSVNHTHDLDISGAASGSARAAATTKPLTTAAALSHTHSYIVAPTTGSANAGSTDAASVTVTAANAQPRYYEFILIKPSDGLQDVPSNAVVLCDTEVDVSGHTKLTAADTRFVKIAPTSTDGGGTGGASTHVHATSHSHSMAGSHSHGNGTWPAEDGAGTSVEDIFLGTAFAAYGSHHSTSTINANTPLVNNNNFDTNSTSSEPAYIQLIPWQNTSGGALTQEDIVIPYVGTAGSIPAPWLPCDGTMGTTDLTSRQIKLTTTNSSVKALGGSNTHLHTSASHDHTSPAHDHTYTAIIAQVTSNVVRTGPVVATTTHTHSGQDLTAAVITINSASVSDTSTDDIRYLYRTTLFIKNPRNARVHIRGNTSILGKAVLK